MNKYIATLLLSIMAISLNAQEYITTRVGIVTDGSDIIIPNNSTTIEVELLVEESVVTPGIYARYAQKYLSLRAPLVATTTYQIINARIGEVSANPTQSPLTPAAQNIEYFKLPVDQYSATVLNPEDAAREAAAAIFTIRRQRRDIINGEAGEGYFGAGLKDAMERLDAMEMEYIELFMGSQTTSQSTHKYIFTPQPDANRHVLARFDTRSGVLPANNLTGVPIYMQFTPSEIPDMTKFLVKPKSKGSGFIKIAPPTQCVLYNDSDPIASTVITIYEFAKEFEIELLAN